MWPFDQPARARPRTRADRRLPPGKATAQRLVLCFSIGASLPQWESRGGSSLKKPSDPHIRSKYHRSHLCVLYVLSLGHTRSHTVLGTLTAAPRKRGGRASTNVVVLHTRVRGHRLPPVRAQRRIDALWPEWHTSVIARSVSLRIVVGHRRARCWLSSSPVTRRGFCQRRDGVRRYTKQQQIPSIPCLFFFSERLFSASIQSPTAASARLSQKRGLSTQSRTSGTLMILPQVHLRKPCYDFYFL